MKRHKVSSTNESYDYDEVQILETTSELQLTSNFNQTMEAMFSQNFPLLLF